MLTDEMSRRRMLLTGGGAAVAGAALVLKPSLAGAQDFSAADDHDHCQGLIGTWLLTHTDDPSESDPSPTPGLSTTSFAPGGIFLIHDLNPPGPPGQGAWERTGRNSFAFRFLSSGQQGPPPPGSNGPPPVFVVTVDGKGTLGDGQISGSYTFDVVDGDNKPLQNGSGNFTATPLSAAG
jgi:hypothetical protein